MGCSSHPTIGTVGLTEPEAREKYGDKVKICGASTESYKYYSLKFFAIKN